MSTGYPDQEETIVLVWGLNVVGIGKSNILPTCDSIWHCRSYGVKVGNLDFNICTMFIMFNIHAQKL